MGLVANVNRLILHHKMVGIPDIGLKFLNGLSLAENPGNLLEPTNIHVAIKPVFNSEDCLHFSSVD